MSIPILLTPYTLFDPNDQFRYIYRYRIVDPKKAIAVVFQRHLFGKIKWCYNIMASVNYSSGKTEDDVIKCCLDTVDQMIEIVDRILINNNYILLSEQEYKFYKTFL